VSTRSYRIAPPLTIQIEGSEIVITDGVISLKHEGKVKVKAASRSFVEFELGLEEPSKPVVPKEIDGGYIHVFSKEAKIPSRGIRAVYEYYKRRNNGSYHVVVWRGYKKRRFHLGSLGDSNSLLRKALDVLPVKGIQFHKGGLYKKLPKDLAHGQMVKAVLDILTEEKYLTIKEVNGIKEVYERTEKTI